MYEEIKFLNVRKSVNKQHLQIFYIWWYKYYFYKKWCNLVYFHRIQNQNHWYIHFQKSKSYKSLESKKSLSAAGHFVQLNTIFGGQIFSNSSKDSSSEKSKSSSRISHSFISQKFPSKPSLHMQYLSSFSDYEDKKLL